MLILSGILSVLQLMPATAHFAYDTGRDKNSRYFTIDYEHNQFIKNGKPFRYISGEMHYYRIPRQYWRDRLLKLRAAGLNAVSTYIPWNLHEPLPNQYHFSLDADFTKFLDIAHELGLLVLFRPGPYTCGEWDFGGLPWWLLKTPGLQNTRSSDPEYLRAVQRWFDVLLPMIKPYLYKNGGPIIMIQVENEYGSYRAPGCDHNYGLFLRDLFESHVGNDVLLYTTDGGGLGYLACGYIPGVYTTVDFGVGNTTLIYSAFEAQRTYAPKGPLVNSEFYPGWLDLWGTPHRRVPTQYILDAMTHMYYLNASFNFYMFMGGTNFGYMGCSMHDGKAVTTSYDYDAPMSETGDLTDKYYAIRSHIQLLTNYTIAYPVPEPIPKRAYGRVRMRYVGSLVELISTLSPASLQRQSEYPMSMEELDAPYGFVLYETTLTTSGAATLYAPGVRDRAYVMINGRLQGVLIGEYGTYKRHTMTVTGTAGQKLQMLVENLGRKCAGYPDRKGLVTNATLNGVFLLTNWTHYPIQLDSIFYNNQIIKYHARSKREVDPTPSIAAGYSPSLYVGSFASNVRQDTFFDPTGWSKGQLYVNGYNVGRYWPSVGPQVTLYTPAPMLRAVNYALMLELERPGNCADATGFDCAVSFTDTHVIDKDVDCKHVNFT